MYKSSYNKGFKRKRYKSSYSRGLGSAKYSKSKPRRSSTGAAESTLGLKIARIVVALLLVGVIAGTIIIGSSVFKIDTSYTHSDVYKSAEKSEPDLLKVVNKSNPVDKSYVPELVELDGKISVSPYLVEGLSAMLTAASKDGVSLGIERGYVSYEEQDKLYQAKYKSYIDKYNLTEVKAQAKTVTTVPQAGRSEFQTGLLIGFKSDEKVSFELSKAYLWLQNHCIEYGFVQRYTADKTSQTGMNADYTAFRYVGVNNAKVMRSVNRCLEEYRSYINSRG